MNPIALARMGLMGLGRLGPWLARGTGWGKKAKGIPGTPGTRGVLGAGTRPVRATRGGAGQAPRTGFRSQPAGTAGTTMAGEATIPGLPAGFARQHPVWTGIAGTGAALGATTGIYGALGGEEEVVSTQLPQQKAGWAPPEDFLSLSEQARTDAEKGKSDMKKMLKYGFLIAAAGGDPSKFFERSSDVAKATEVYKKNERYANQFDAVFVKGNMPDNPKDAYERLIKVGMGPKEAMEITGQVSQLMGKTEMERAMNTLSQVYASQGEEAAARLLMTYWATGQLDLPEHLKYAQEEDLFEAARSYVGGAGLGATEATGEEVEIL